MKVSVIVPIYKVERFIARCVTSLMKQTLQDVEYIFVDDATPDQSLSILQEVLAAYPERKKYVKILHHKDNQGLPAARNTGLEVSEGEYIFHCDSDDYVEPDMLETLYNEALKNNADIVWCDWFLTFGQNERYMKQPNYNTPLEAVKAMLGGAMKFNVWNKLVKRELYQKNAITFPAGFSMGEDMTMILPFVFAKKIHYVPKAFYHYVKTNSGAYTQNHSERHLKDLQYNVARVEMTLRQRLGASLDKEIAFFKLETKFPLFNNGEPIVNNTHSGQSYIQMQMSLFVKILISHFVLACWNGLHGKKQWWIVRLYYWVIIKFVYGVIYK